MGKLYLKASSVTSYVTHWHHFLRSNEKLSYINKKSNEIALMVGAIFFLVYIDATFAEEKIS